VTRRKEATPAISMILAVHKAVELGNTTEVDIAIL
jgi:hypothetical protein